MAITKYYVDAQGVFLGGYTENNPAIPVGAIEVANPPIHADQIWSGSIWEDTKDKLKEYLAQYRWEKEVGGIVFNTVPIRTDDRSKMLLASIQKQIDDLGDPNHVRKVKTVAGFLDLTDGTLTALYTAVIVHVQNCFDIEEAIIALIDDDTLTTKAAVETEFDAQYAAL